MHQSAAETERDRWHVLDGVRTCPFCEYTNTVKQRKGLKRRLRPVRTECDRCRYVFAI